MRRGRILILLGLILAVVTAALVFFFLTQAATETVPEEIQREEVVIAMQPIGEDEPVEGRLELRAMPVESIPEGAYRSLEATSGLLAAGPIPQGSIIQAGMLQTIEEQMREGQVSKLVEPGFVAVAFPITELSSVSYGILPGDSVDVLVTFPFIDLDAETQIKEPLCPPLCPSASAEGEVVAQQVSGQIQRLATQLTLQDMLVLGVGRWTYKLPEPETEDQVEGSDAAPSAAEPPEYITLQLESQDALVLKLAREYGASIELAVRAQEDHQQFVTEQVTLDYVMARFGMSVPPKADYTIEVLPAR